eukprot:g29629.t1
MNGRRDIEKEYSYRLREFERSEDKRIRNLKQDLRDLEPASEPTDREKRKFADRDLDFRESDVKEWKRRREDGNTLGFRRFGGRCRK